MASAAGHLVNLYLFKSLYLGSAPEEHVEGRVGTRESKGRTLTARAEVQVLPSCLQVLRVLPAPASSL
jgi:hypothetical protein